MSISAFLKAISADSRASLRSGLSRVAITAPALTWPPFRAEIEAILPVVPNMRALFLEAASLPLESSCLAKSVRPRVITSTSLTWGEYCSLPSFPSSEVFLPPHEVTARAAAKAHIVSILDLIIIPPFP